MSSEAGARIGCEHVPARFWDRWRDSVEDDVGRAVVKAIAAIDQVIAGDARSLLLSGPPGAGKSLLAAVACNESARERAGDLSVLERQLVDLDGEYEAEVRSQAETYDERVARVSRLNAVATQRSELIRKIRSKERLVDATCPRWVAVPHMLGRLRREMNGQERPAAAELAEILDRSHTALVLDDVGREKASDWTAEVLHELAASRYDASATLIVTSNLSPAELARVGYGPMVSRLADEGVILEMRTAPDYRMTKLRRSVA